LELPSERISITIDGEGNNVGTLGLLSTNEMAGNYAKNFWDSGPTWAPCTSSSRVVKQGPLQLDKDIHYFITEESERPSLRGLLNTAKSLRNFNKEFVIKYC